MRPGRSPIHPKKQKGRDNMMNKQIEILRLKKAYHRYSDCVDGVDFNLAPKELLAMYNVDSDSIYLSNSRIAGIIRARF